MKDMVRILCALAVLVIAAPASAEATLHGVVVRDREHGAPVTGVAVSSVGANAATTGNDGQFVLTYRERRPGQEIGRASCRERV